MVRVVEVVFGGLRELILIVCATVTINNYLAVHNSPEPEPPSQILSKPTSWKVVAHNDGYSITDPNGRQYVSPDTLSLGIFFEKKFK